jgi:glycosyltransferase involved in cell wall biosynthesis
VSLQAPRIVLCQTAVPDYRQAFLEVLLSRLGPQFRVYAGEEYFDRSTKTRIRIGDALSPLRNRFLFGRRLLWQSGSLAAARGANVAILEFNPRILSVWLLLIWRSLRNRPTLLWGHAWSRSGRASRTEPVRRAMRRLAKGVIVYTRTQQRELSECDTPGRVFVAPNALYLAEFIQPAEPPSPPDSILYVGRLVPAKKPEVLLEAFLRIHQELPTGTRLVIVGQGPLLSPMRDRASEVPEARVEFLGHVSDVDALRRLYGRAIVAVSPGFVGLSITQSLGFGVPMLISRDEPHAPEIEAARHGWNAFMYAPSSPESLARALLQTALNGGWGWASRADISADCRNRYSAEALAR